MDIARDIHAPVVAGQRVGVVKVLYRNQEVASSEVVLTESIGQKSWLGRIREYFAQLFTAGRASA